MTRNSIRYSILIVDLFWMTAALLVTSRIHLGAELSAGYHGVLLDMIITLVLSASFWSLLFFALHLDGFDEACGMLGTAVSLALGVVILVVLLAAGTYLLHRAFSCLVLAWASGLAWVGFVAARWVVGRLLMSRYAARTSRRAVIIGDGRVATEVAHKIARHPELRWRVVGFVFPTGRQSGPGRGQESFSTLDIPGFLRSNQITDIILVMGPLVAPEVSALLARCRADGVRISLVPSQYELYSSHPKFVQMEGLPLLTMEKHESNSFLRQVKSATEPIVATFLMAAALPVLGIAALWVRKRHGKAFIAEERCGQHGTPFQLYRLNLNRDADYLPGIDAFLVRTSLTELPQLWNVILGDMSVVGPRPESPDRVKHYSEWHEKRLAVRPGITGLAQVHGLRHGSSSEDKTRFDLQYIVNWSPLLDVVLALQTVLTLAQRLWTPPHKRGRAGRPLPSKQPWVQKTPNANRA
jgi:lipopolysaccharide/colanic/teichoic acid biosynthesis glycosyltransferase